MGTQPVAAKFFTKPIANVTDGDTRSIGANDAITGPVRLDFRKKLLLNIDSFDDGFDDPIGLRYFVKVSIKATDGDELVGVTSEKTDPVSVFLLY